MKKMFLFLILSAFALFGCQFASAADNYQVMVLGDLHYDGMAYHTSPAATKNRAKERIRNCSMWEKATPDLLTLASKNMDKNIPFVIQVGDFVQGDCETSELQEKMIADGFAKVKSDFPNHKLLPVRGNHDVRMFKGNSGTPTINAFFPLIAKELGVAKINGTYTVRHGKDLYIFFDGFLPKNGSLKSLQKALADNTDVRYTFFISHLPVLNCSLGNASWLVKDFKAIRQLLLDRNAIIITAHTHMPSVIQAKRNGKQLSQAVVSSVGKDWSPETAPAIAFNGFDAYCKKLGKTIERQKHKPSFDDMKSFEFPVYEIYKFKSCVGFAKLNVSENGVSIEYYTNASGKPAMVKKLR